MQQSHHSNLYRRLEVSPVGTGWGKYVHFLKGDKDARWRQVLEKVKKVDEEVFPHPYNLFKPFKLCSFKKTRVVILGTRPINSTAGVSDGLAFSISPRKGREYRSYFVDCFLKELREDVGIQPPNNHCSLTYWARHNGILLLNISLTATSNVHKTHADLGWDLLTYEVLKSLNYGKKNPIVFIFLGKTAQKYGVCIDRTRHYVINAGYPRANKGNTFIGSKVFSRAAKALGVHPRELWSFTPS